MLRDIGEKMNKGIDQSDPKKKWYPSMSATADQIPELKDKEVGDKCYLRVLTEVTGYNQHDGKEIKYNLDLKKAEYTGQTKGKGVKEVVEDAMDGKGDKEYAK